VIDHRKRSKPLGEATQFNGRQSHHSLLFFARILPQISLRNLRKLDCEAKTGAHPRIKSEGMLLRTTRGRAPLSASYLELDHYTNKAVPKRRS
ncbi:MAG TPA: hypothetical protein VN831_24425, partial [Bradyrhizobium sp.]|nr:hypothetical protein [Bradyrhizobium sp.]